MDYDATKLDEVVLALLHFNSQTDHGVTRAWKGFDWDSLDRLHAQGFISNPKSKAKSVVLTEEGVASRRSYSGGTLARPYNRPLQPPAFAGHGPAIADAAAVDRQIR